MLCPLYIAEISAPVSSALIYRHDSSLIFFIQESRGSLVSLEQFSIVLGVVVGFWLGFATRTLEGSKAWRIPLWVQLGPGAILLIGSTLLPSSPRMLVIRGKLDEATVVLEKLRGREGMADPLIQARASPVITPLVLIKCSA